MKKLIIIIAIIGGFIMMTSNYYYTVAGFYTVGTVNIEGGKFINIEKINRMMNGVTEVKNITKILLGGRLQTKAQFNVNGDWQNGHEIIYEIDDKAKLLFY